MLVSGGFKRAYFDPYCSLLWVSLGLTKLVRLRKNIFKQIEKVISAVWHGLRAVFRWFFQESKIAKNHGFFAKNHRIWFLNWFLWFLVVLKRFIFKPGLKPHRFFEKPWKTTSKTNLVVVKPYFSEIWAFEKSAIFKISSHKLPINQKVV